MDQPNEQANPVTEEIVKEDPKKDDKKSSDNVTTDEPKTKIPKHPGRVAAGKALQERNRKIREAKKLLAHGKIQENKKDSPEPSSMNVMPGFYLLSIAGFIVSLIGLYYKRKEYVTATKAEEKNNLVAQKEKTNLIEMD